ncbi:M14 family zinc carboxypeptidase [Allorhodopirellula solitaria]|uniref:Zinc carboxypeptidase n=1 Tax=Allorhodopirellula solitaria TaxID=2527987 RepID=A0A5C5YIU3_9BACT|nr:M14 family zinc carboxypeptidase [Allorhodopirellula solitaria]TWT74781.1 Zinc carboxypeptidase [Allorhodopirellula solitaria]
MRVPTLIFATAIVCVNCLGQTKQPNDAQSKQDLSEPARIVDIQADYPGGNINVESNDGKTVDLSPRLDGGRNWFYWNFEAIAERAGEVAFVFPEKVAGFENGAVGFQGPAISTDQGVSWRWMGNNTALVRGRSFTYTFSDPGERVRFAVTLPYTESNWQAFLQDHQANRHLQTRVLTQSRQGRDVELVQIGRAGPGKIAMLVTARHHATETIASFVLEGMLAAAMSDDPVGVEFRQRFVLYAVPFVDKDGVERGDQGKGRTPHDHNRDYGEKSIYPEVQAIMELGEEQQIGASLDLHCPTLVMDDHQLMYFVGPSDVPTNNAAIVDRFAKAIKEELPDGAPFGPLVWLKPIDDEKRTMNSGYFASRPGCLTASTLEIPFAPSKASMDQPSLDAYGWAVLRAWNQLDLQN